MTNPNVSIRRQHEIFIRKGHEILRLRKLGKGGEPFRNTHVAYTGFNVAFKKFFDGADPQEALDRALRDGHVKLYIVRGGATFDVTATCAANLNKAETAFAATVEEFMRGLVEKPAKSKSVAKSIREQIADLMLLGRIDEASQLAAKHRGSPESEA